MEQGQTQMDKWFPLPGHKFPERQPPLAQTLLQLQPLLD
jgi:hypothetical protein